MDNEAINAITSFSLAMSACKICKIKAIQDINERSAILISLPELINYKEHTFILVSF